MNTRNIYEKKLSVNKLTNSSSVTNINHCLRLNPSIKKDGRGMWHVWVRGEMNTGLWCENLKEKRRDVVSTVMNFRIQLNTGYFLTSWETISFSTSTPLNGASHPQVD